MRLALLSGTTYHPLAGEAGVSERVHSSAADLRIEPQAEKQMAAYVRGTYAKAIDRGNLLNVVGFSTTRQFDSPAAAQIWCLDYDGAFPRSGVLVMDSVSAGGTLTRRHLQDAVADPPSRRVEGATAQLSYSVSGGGIKTPASGTLTAGTGNPADATTVTIGSRVYRFKSTMAAAADVKIGADYFETLANLAKAVNLTGTVGIHYYAGTTVHPDAAAVMQTTGGMRVFARVAGTAGNSIVTTESVTGWAWDGATLTGGAD